LINFLCYSFFNTQVSIWSFSYFFTFFYIFLIFTSTIYLVSNVKEFTLFSSFRNSSSFQNISGLDLLLLFFAPIFLFFLINYTWTGSAVSVWFSHLTFNHTQIRVAYLVFFVFGFLWISYLTSFYYPSQEVYDFTIVLFSFFIWMVLLFFSSNLFTVIFFIEILSTAISLTIITSVFSSLYFYNNIDLSNHNYFNHSTPFSFLQTSIFFFWISLIASLGLFVFLTLFYLALLSLDWFNLEYTFYYYILSGNSKSFTLLSLVWLSFLFCLFLKCGLVPFFFWKPIFFKGIPLHSLFFLYYFFLLFPISLLFHLSPCSPKRTFLF
jgi:hypothetical protein